MGELLGLELDNSDDRQTGQLLQARAACESISSECVALMTRRGLKDYDITHQVLYIMVAAEV